jgi:hypothetical protein
MKNFLACLFIAFIPSVSNAQEQCSYKFKISSKTELSAGTIEVDVKAKTAFSVELYSDIGIERKLVQTRTGSGNEKIIFKGLSIDRTVYRIAVVVPSENNFLCKKKMSEDIFFEIN